MAREGALDALDYRIYELASSSGPTTLSELSRELGRSKSVVFRRLRKLSSMGLLELREVGGVLLVSIPSSPSRVVEVGMLRASEYPYVLGFLRRLRDRYGPVGIRVYDDAFREAMDLASGRIQLAMVPALTLLIVHRLTGGRVKIVGGGSGGGMGIVRGRSGSGHSVVMMSNTELCAEREGLEPPRAYAASAYEILGSVDGGTRRAGVLWEPFLSMAEGRGLRVEECELEECCLLGANSGVSGDYGWISRAFAESVSEARSVDVSAYASLVGMPAGLVEASMRRYRFVEEPDADYLRRSIQVFRRAALPDSAASDAIAT